MRGKKIAASALGKTGLVLLLAVLAVCLPTAAPRALGLEAYAVTSGSMEPEIPVGSLLYVREMQPEEIREGDVIVFYGDGTKGTETAHRVVKNDPEEGAFTTKGDANAQEDLQPVPYSALVGKAEKHVPYLGNLMPLVGSPRGRLYLGCILAGGVLLRILASVLDNSGPHRDTQ